MKLPWGNTDSARVPALHSFDLFDTLVTRRFLFPDDVFWDVALRLQRRGLLATSAAAFRQARIQADGATRARLNLEEISLEQIYETLARQFSWGKREREMAAATEIEAEHACVLPVAETVARWNALPDSSRLIISDTYLDSKTLLQLLATCGIPCHPSQLYVSSHYGRTKFRGQLYSIVAAERGVAPSQIAHLGDNPHSDIRKAQRVGIKPELCSRAHPTRYERLFYASGGHHESLIAGALRAGRVQFPGGTARQRVQWAIGSAVVAPLFFSYVSWLLEAAEKRKIPHLYFLSRDGQILLEIAKKLEPQIPCSYLYASRQAWFLPSLTAIDDAALGWMLVGTRSSTLRQILSRVEIEPEQVPELLAEYGYDASSWDKPAGQRAPVKRLLTDARMQAIILQRAQQARRRAVKYLAAQGVTRAESFGTVDMGWRGHLQQALLKMLALEAPLAEQRSTAFYLSLSGAPASTPQQEFVSYSSEKIARRQEFESLIEMLAAADHGGVLGYADHGDASDAVLAGEKNEGALAWGLPYLRQGVFAAVEQLCKVAQELGMSYAELGQHLKDPSRQALLAFFNQPNQEEADAFGSFPFQFDQGHSQVLETAPLLAVCMACVFAMLGDQPFPFKVLWKQGTVARSLPVLLHRSAFALLHLREVLAKKA